MFANIEMFMVCIDTKKINEFNSEGENKCTAVYKFAM